MDKRFKILVVEDDEILREVLVGLFKDAAGFRVDGTANAAEAIAAADRCSYDVAVVDIILDQEDKTNRAGVDVISHLSWLREGTQPVVLSGLVLTNLLGARDLRHEYGAAGYLEKRLLVEKGSDFLIEAVRSFTGKGPPHPQTEWKNLVKVLSGGRQEDGFVDGLLLTLAINDCYEMLNSSLRSACRFLVPLLLEGGEQHGLRSDMPGIVSGRFWSKGQGKAVEIVLYGPTASMDALEARWHVSQRALLHDRTQAGLRVLVFECPGQDREQFFLLE